MPMDSNSQKALNCLSMVTASAMDFIPTANVCVTMRDCDCSPVESETGPDNTHPNLEYDATGPSIPRTVSPVRNVPILICSN